MIYHAISSEWDYFKNKEVIERFERHGIPVVLIDKYFMAEPKNYSYVTIDNFKGGYDATQHLIDLGHTRIAFIRQPMSSPVILREKGYRHALLESGIRHCPEWSRVIDKQHSIADICTELFAEVKPPPTAIFASNDVIARDTYLNLAILGLRIPQDVAIVGFDDLPSAARMNPPLTTVHQPFETEARIAVQFLSERIKNISHMPHKMLSSELIVRESSGVHLPKTAILSDKVSTSDEVHRKPPHVLKQDSNSVGLVVRGATDARSPDSFYAKILQGIQDVAEKNDIQLISSKAFKDRYQEYSVVRNFLRENARGLIFVATYDLQPPAQEELVYLFRRRTPFVSASAVDNKSVSFAGADELHAGFLAADRFIRSGRKKIGAFLTYATDKRFQGIIDAIDLFDLPHENIFIFRNQFRRSLSNDQAAYVWGKSLNLKETPVEGIICYDDQAALGLIRALTERGINVPDDVAVIGYGDSVEESDAQVPLTTIHIPNYEIGRQAMKILFKHLEGKTEPIQTLLKPHLVVRHSG